MICDEPFGVNLLLPLKGFVRNVWFICDEPFGVTLLLPLQGFVRNVWFICDEPLGVLHSHHGEALCVTYGELRWPLSNPSPRHCDCRVRKTRNDGSEAIHTL